MYDIVFEGSFPSTDINIVHVRTLSIECSALSATNMFVHREYIRLLQGICHDVELELPEMRHLGHLGALRAQVAFRTSKR